MRAASSRLFAVGTALSWSPQTTRVGASMQPRTGMLDQVEMAASCQSKPNGCGSRPPCFAIWRQQDLGDIAGVAWNRADPTSSRKQHESVHAGGMADRELLGDCAAVGVPDDVRFLDADCVEDPCSDIRQHRHRVRDDRSLARPDPGSVKRNDSSVSKRAAKTPSCPSGGTCR